MPVINKPNQHFDATTYTGTGSALSVTNAGGFQPDFVWIKTRNQTGYGHELFDSVRGATKYLISNSTGAESTEATSLTAFNSNGFSVGSFGFINGSGDSIVGWNWKAGGAAVTNTAGSISAQVSANPTAGFSIVTYTGNGTSSQTCGHGLGVTPSMVIWKNRNDVDAWIVYHSALTTSEYLVLNTTAAKATVSGLFTGISSTVLPLNNASAAINANGFNYVAYCFAPVAGYSAFGSYTGNASTDGSFVYLGFKPRFVMVKRTDSTTNWWMIDTSRSSFNQMADVLLAESSGAEFTSGTGWPGIDYLSNGFKLRGTASGINASGGTYIYMAFAEAPFKFANAR